MYLLWQITYRVGGGGGLLVRGRRSLYSSSSSPIERLPSRRRWSLRYLGGSSNSSRGSRGVLPPGLLSGERSLLVERGLYPKSLASSSGFFLLMRSSDSSSSLSSRLRLLSLSRSSRSRSRSRWRLCPLPLRWDLSLSLSRRLSRSRSRSLSLCRSRERSRYSLLWLLFLLSSWSARSLRLSLFLSRSLDVERLVCKVSVDWL